jgi:hypothetical protein
VLDLRAAVTLSRSLFLHDWLPFNMCTAKLLGA